MKFRSESSEFREAVATALRTTGARATLPAMAGVLIEATEDRLTMSSTDLELATVLSIPVKGEAVGRTLVPGRLLGDVSRNLPAGALEAELIDGNRIRLRCGKAKFELRVIDPSDFPALPEPASEAASVTLSADDFRQLVDTTTVAAGTDDARPVLTGVNMEIADGKLTAAATDSYRLAVDSIASGAGPGSAVIPARALTEAGRAVTDDNDVRITFEPSQVTFSTGDFRLTTRLIEGKFPDFRQLIPGGFERRLEVDRAELVEVVDRCAIVTEGGSAPVLIHVQNDGVRVTAEDREKGSADESLAGKLEGEPLTISFNAKYLTQGLKACGTERVAIEMRDELKPAILRPVHDEDGEKAETDPHEYLYLLMPVRV